MKVPDIQQKADHSAIELRAAIREQLGKKGFVESRQQIGQRLGKTYTNPVGGPRGPAYLLLSC